MKLSWRVELVQWALIAAMFVVAAVTWPHAPERMPIHWNLQGEADGFGPKFAGLLLLPLIVIGLYGLLLLLPRFDPYYKNYQSFAGAYNAIRVTLVVVMSIIYGVTVLAGLGYRVDVGTVVGLAVAAMFLVLGYTMGKLRPNWFVGVRTPWTLSSKLSWTKTHRLAGRLFIVMGLAMGAWAVLQTAWAFALMMTIGGASLVWMVVYSYLVYRKDPNRMTPTG